MNSTSSRRTASGSSASPATSTTGARSISTRRWRRSRRRRPISARAASISSFTAAGRWWWRAARASRRSSSSDIEAPSGVPRHDRRARGHGGAAPYRRAAHRDRLALSGAAQSRHGGLSRRAWLRDRPRRRHGCAVQDDCRACRRPTSSVRRRRARAAPGLRRALPALPAMAGGADRRRAGARHRHASHRLFACELFRRLQGARHQ